MLGGEFMSYLFISFFGMRGVDEFEVIELGV